MATKTAENKSNSDWLKWLAAVIIVIAGIYANYYFINIAAPIRIIGWIVLCAVALFVAAQTAKGKDAVKFISEARMEIRKVVWPTRQETMHSTMIVLVLVGLCGLILWLLDTGLIALIGWLTGQRG